MPTHAALHVVVVVVVVVVFVMMVVIAVVLFFLLLPGTQRPGKFTFSQNYARDYRDDKNKILNSTFLVFPISPEMAPRRSALASLETASSAVSRDAVEPPTGAPSSHVHTRPAPHEEEQQLLMPHHHQHHQQQQQQQHHLTLNHHSSHQHHHQLHPHHQHAR